MGTVAFVEINGHLIPAHVISFGSYRCTYQWVMRSLNDTGTGANAGRIWCEAGFKSCR